MDEVVYLIWTQFFLSESFFATLCKIDCLGLPSKNTQSIFSNIAFQSITFCNLVNKFCFLKLKVQSCKLNNNKYMIASTQITNTEIFALMAVLAV